MNALANTLRGTSPSVPPLAAQADVTPRQVALARAGRPINAGAYLALCGAAGVDPVSGSPRPVKSISPNVAWWLLATALHVTRGSRGLNQRKAAKAIGVSPSTVCRVERCKPVSVPNMVKVCGFVGVHPDGYTAPSGCPEHGVTRETPIETRCSNMDIGRGSSAHA